MCHNASQQLIYSQTHVLNTEEWLNTALYSKRQSIVIWRQGEPVSQICSRGRTRIQNAGRLHLEFSRSGFYTKQRSDCWILSVSVRASWRAPGANVSVTCYKLPSLLPWTPSAEKYKWATKRGVRRRERAARQTARGRWRGGGEQRKPRYEYGGASPSPRCQTGDLSSVQWLMKTHGACVCECVCLVKDTKEGRGQVESEMWGRKLIINIYTVYLLKIIDY